MIRLLLLTFVSWSAFAADAEYNGEFSQVNEGTGICQRLFEPPAYETKFFLVGPTGLTAVVHFTGADKSGFFEGMNLIGRIGGSQDIFVTKSVQDGPTTFEIVGEGIASPELLLLQVKITAFRGGTALCQTSAEYSGFNR